MIITHEGARAPCISCLAASAMIQARFGGPRTDIDLLIDASAETSRSACGAAYLAVRSSTTGGARHGPGRPEPLRGRPHRGRDRGRPDEDGLRPRLRRRPGARSRSSRSRACRSRSRVRGCSGEPSRPCVTRTRSISPSWRVCSRAAARPPSRPPMTAAEHPVFSWLEDDAQAGAAEGFLQVALSYFAGTRGGEGRVSTPLTADEIARRFDEPLPRGGRPLDEVLARLRERRACPTRTTSATRAPWATRSRRRCRRPSGPSRSSARSTSRSPSGRCRRSAR